MQASRLQPTHRHSSDIADRQSGRTARLHCPAINKTDSQDQQGPTTVKAKQRIDQVIPIILRWLDAESEGQRRSAEHHRGQRIAHKDQPQCDDSDNHDHRPRVVTPAVRIEIRQAKCGRVQRQCQRSKHQQHDRAPGHGQRLEHTQSLQGSASPAAPGC